MSEFDFRKSTYSSGDAHGECVEVARNVPGTVAVRDSKDMDGPILQLAPGAWTAFLRLVSHHPSAKLIPCGVT